jgi:hypothetical protein
MGEHGAAEPKRAGVVWEFYGVLFKCGHFVVGKERKKWRDGIPDQLQRM